MGRDCRQRAAKARAAPRRPSPGPLRAHALTGSRTPIAAGWPDLGRSCTSRLTVPFREPIQQPREGRILLHFHVRMADRSLVERLWPRAFHLQLIGTEDFERLLQGLRACAARWACTRLPRPRTASDRAPRGAGLDGTGDRGDPGRGRRRAHLRLGGRCGGSRDRGGRQLRPLRGVVQQFEFRRLFRKPLRAGRLAARPLAALGHPEPRWRRRARAD